MLDSMHDLTAMETRAVACAIGVTRRRWRHPAYAVDDMRQEASIAVILARPRCSQLFAPQQQERYFTRRAIGGIVDGLRQILRQEGKTRSAVSDARVTIERMSLNKDNDESAGAAEVPDADSPCGHLATRRAIAAIAALPAPLPTVAYLSVSGSSNAHIAKVLGVDPSMVSRWRSKLAAELRKHL